MAHTRLGAATLYRALRAELGIDRLAGLSDEMRGDVPLDTRPLQGRPPRTPEDRRLPPRIGSWAASSQALVAAYAGGKMSPSDVVERVLSGALELGARTPSIGPLLELAGEFARREADAAALRYKSARPLGPLDGVPFAVKEQTAVRGFARRGGTSFVDGSPQLEDATCVARLRMAGAIVVGTTPMTEYGMSPVGFNAHRTMPRNPHAPDRVAGGSSTGSGVAVATGLVPFAIGADGGGSIRIPSALNGVFGIKPTWGRVSRHGDISTGSVAHLGPLACSAVDLARVLEVIAGPDADDPETRDAPTLAPGALVGALGRGVRGLRIGLTEGEWADAAPAVARAGEEALRSLEQEGASLVPVRIDHARYAASMGYLAIGIEALAAVSAEWRRHAQDMTPDLQVSFASLERASAAEYVDSQRLRSGLRREVARVLGEVDLIALPTTARTAARITDAQMESGFLDAKTLDSLCRFTFLANLTGLPAASMPVGRDDASLPIGLQLVGDAWDEATVLAAMAHLERIEVARAERPLAFVELLA
jgi:Asp-tRNA(Asn)/Glu-tRNA(Gln) amidotransferase A subunit family amidase